MATIKLRILVSELANVVTLFDRIKVYRSTTGPTGTYDEITTVGSRIPILADESVYEYDDVAGDPSYYYKTSYFHSISSLESGKSNPVKGEGTGNYVSIQDLRDEGITEAMLSDSRALALIQLYERYVDQVTGQWFYPRDLEIILDGNGSLLMQLGVPIIRLDELYVNSDSNALDPSLYTVYNRIVPDDRRNPRVKLNPAGHVGSDFYSTLVFGGSTLFQRGEQNQRLVGCFGFVEADGTAPPLIKYATKKLISMHTQKLGAGGAGPSQVGPIVEEWTDRHRIRYSEKATSGSSSSSGYSGTGDPELDMILSQYRRPPIIAAPYGEIG
jgi:hypothetical protein